VVHPKMTKAAAIGNIDLILRPSSMSIVFALRMAG
jgi:hypothetical protein